MSVKRTLMAVEDSRDDSGRLSRLFPQPSWSVVRVATISEAALRIADGQPDVLIAGLGTHPRESIRALCRLRRRHPKVKVIVIAASGSPTDVLEALKAHAFSYFTVSCDDEELRASVERALSEPDWDDGIQVLSDKPEWVAVRVRCKQLTADRLLNFFDELSTDIPDEDRSGIGTAFREILMNAIEHGGQFDPTKTVDITRIRTDRLLMYLVQDPGPGFDFDRLPHAAVSTPDDPVRHVMYREEQGMRAGGFGLLVAGGLVDEVIHNASGNQAVLIKHLARQPAEAVDAA